MPVREQDPALRATNFKEVCYGYNLEEARTEASRCLHCRNPAAWRPVRSGGADSRFHLPPVRRRCGGGLPDVIARDSSLPSICGRVCPQETQCEGACVLGIRGEPVAVGKLERFVGDWNIGHAAGSAPRRCRSATAVGWLSWGSGPAGLACASDLAKMGYK